MSLNVLSLNAQGLNSPQKTTKAFHSFSSLSAHVICLQETHFSVSSAPKFIKMPISSSLYGISINETKRCANIVSQYYPLHHAERNKRP